MSSFLADTKEIDENIDIKTAELPMTMLKAGFLPYYVDPTTMGLTVVLKRSILPGAASRTGRKMGLTCLTTELPEDNPLTIEEVFNTLNVNATLQDSIPFGSIMLNPIATTDSVELVLAHIDPPLLLDEARGIISQAPGEYEIGIVGFDEILTAIQENFIQDTTTRLMLSELYILAMEEANNQEQNPEGLYESKSAEGVIGAGEQYPQAAQSSVGKDLENTSDIPNSIIEENSQMDFGAIYSKK